MSQASSMSQIRRSDMIETFFIVIIRFTIFKLCILCCLCLSLFGIRFVLKIRNILRRSEIIELLQCITSRDIGLVWSVRPGGHSSLLTTAQRQTWGGQFLHHLFQRAQTMVYIVHVHEGSSDGTHLTVQNE